MLSVAPCLEGGPPSSLAAFGLLICRGGGIRRPHLVGCCREERRRTVEELSRKAKLLMSSTFAPSPPTRGGCRPLSTLTVQTRECRKWHHFPFLGTWLLMETFERIEIFILKACAEGQISSQLTKRTLERGRFSFQFHEQPIFPS